MSDCTAEGLKGLMMLQESAVCVCAYFLLGILSYTVFVIVIQENEPCAQREDASSS